MPCKVPMRSGQKSNKYVSDFLESLKAFAPLENQKERTFYGQAYLSFIIHLLFFFHRIGYLASKPRWQCQRLFYIPLQHLSSSRKQRTASSQCTHLIGQETYGTSFFQKFWLPKRPSHSMVNCWFGVYGLEFHAMPPITSSNQNSKKLVLQSVKSRFPHTSLIHALPIPLCATWSMAFEVWCKLYGDQWGSCIGHGRETQIWLRNWGCKRLNEWLKLKLNCMIQIKTWFPVVQVGFGILVGLDFQMYVNLHQGNQCCIWFSFKLVVGEFLKQKQCWAKAWLIDFQDYFRCQFSIPGFVQIDTSASETTNSLGAGSRGFREFGCQASTSTWKPWLFCADHVWFSVFLDVDPACEGGIEHLLKVDIESIYRSACGSTSWHPHRLWSLKIDCHAGPHHHLLGRRLAAGVEECQWGQEHLGFFQTFCRFASKWKNTSCCTGFCLGCFLFFWINRPWVKPFNGNRILERQIIGDPQWFVKFQVLWWLNQLGTSHGDLCHPDIFRLFQSLTHGQFWTSSIF